MTREDFNEYKEWAEDQIRKANGITLEAASVQWHQARELEKEKMLRQEAEKKAASRQVVSPEELSGWVRANRGELRVPTFKNEDDEEERNAERGQFLYENHSYRIKELTITVLLLRARVAVERRQSTKAQHFAFEAQKLALYFDFPPLESRCLFWKGRAEARFGFLDNALDAFRKALPCEGIYREGKEVRKWIQRAAEAVQRSPVSPMTAQPLKTRSKRISFFGPGENPPEFEPEEDDSDDGEDNDETENNDPVGGDQDQGEIDRTTQNIELAPIPDMPADNTPAARRVSIAEKGKEKLSKDDSGKKGKEISQNF